MNILKKILLILIIFFKSGNLLSENNLFNVNNITVEKKDSFSNSQLADLAIKKSFDLLVERILLKEDIPKVSDIKFSEIKKIVSYYNISNVLESESDKVNFNVKFDKDKIHDLFYKRKISYSDIEDKEFYILPIILEANNINIFSNNYFYENWNKASTNELIEFILPLENIEIIQKIYKERNDLPNVDLKFIFKEYPNKNIAFALIENNNINLKKVYLRTNIQDKNITKNLQFKKKESNEIKFEEKIILEIKEEITNLVKSQNLIDIRTPSFLNLTLNLKKENNLYLLQTRLKNIDLIENLFVQEFNKDYIILKIKYLGKLEKIINQLKKEKINIKLIDDKWYIDIL